MAHKSHHQKRRKERAEENKIARASRDNLQQLIKLRTRPGNSTKERARLKGA